MSEREEYVPSPRPNPRLRPEGAAYAERNRGTMERWFDYTDNGSSGGKANGTSGGGQYGSQVPWAQSEEIPENAKKSMTTGQGGRVGEGLMADSLEEGAMQDLMQKSSELSLSSVRGPAEEAKEYAERNRGTMDHIINNYGVSTPPQNPPQNPWGAQESTSTGTQGPETEAPHPPAAEPQSPRQRTLHQESQGRTWDESRPAPRIRPDGESIAMKNTADSMFGIMNNNDASAQAAPHHPSRQNEESSTEPQSASQPRARPGDGMKNYEKAHDQSEMAAILRGEGDSKRGTSARNIRHLQRSELW
ncbi:hypothetical protein ACOMHN_061072 [Nucella lapillus]